ncbi:MAG TPA: hypothetical protein VH592_13305 [Gemmataceae bacterium]|jgi:hypothetical protein
MATDGEASGSQEYAERPKEGELWQQMIERQQKEGSNRGGYARELLRSLPEEQGKDKELQERSGIAPERSPLMAELYPQSYAEMLREASERTMPEQDRGLER